MFVVREICEGHQTGVPDEIMEKLKIIVNEMMAGDGPVPMLRHEQRHAYEDVCAFAWKGYKAGKEAGKKEPNKGADGAAGRDDGGKKGSKGSKPDRHSTRTKEAREKARARVRERVRPDTATTAERRGASE